MTPEAGRREALGPARAEQGQGARGAAREGRHLAAADTPALGLQRTRSRWRSERSSSRGAARRTASSRRRSRCRSGQIPQGARLRRGPGTPPRSSSPTEGARRRSGDRHARVRWPWRSHVVQRAQRADARGARSWIAKSDTRIVRSYLQSPALLDNRPLPSGFSCLTGRYETWKNEATAVALGESIDVQLSWWHQSERQCPARHDRDRRASAGRLCRAARGRERQLRPCRDGRGLPALLPARAPSFSTTIRYSLRGFLPGQYRVLPTHVYSLERASLNEYGAPAKIRVLARGEESPDKRRPTPDEVLERGKRIFDSLRHRGDGEGLAPSRRGLDSPARALRASHRSMLRRPRPSKRSPGAFSRSPWPARTRRTSSCSSKP